MSEQPEYEKPPPYSPHPQEGSYQPYQSGADSYQPVQQSYPIVHQQPYSQSQQRYISYTQPDFRRIPVQPVAPNYGATAVTIQPEDIIIIGTCPACRIGVVEDAYSCFGIFCAIFFFPLGILFCLLLKDRRCTNCGAYFG